MHPDKIMQDKPPTPGGGGSAYRDEMANREKKRKINQII